MHSPPDRRPKSQTDDADDRHPRAALATAAEAAQRALRGRPSVSIRARFGVSLLLWLIISLGITLTSILLISRIREKLQFLEIGQAYLYEVQQARRFEKNFLLYGTNLNDALEYVRQARVILDEEALSMRAVVGAAEVDSMSGHLRRYEIALMSLQDTSPGVADDPTRREAIESELREHGALMVSSAQEVVRREREAANAMLTISQQIPLPFLVVLILLITYLSFLFGRQMLAPLNRMMLATRRIADGDYRPITPRRKYHDEFSELAMAINHMMYQLVQRQDMLAQSHKLKAVGTLTAGVAHELNNPINNIMLTAALLQEDYDEYSDNDRRDMVADLVSESERAQSIVRNLLDFARESETDAEPVNVRELIDEVLHLAGNQIKLSNVTVETKDQATAHLPPVHGDAQQLKQVFLNIILNALDAMPNGGHLTISTRLDREHHFVISEISDTGAGIPEQYLSNIFDPFFTTKSGGRGTGLGLSVSLGIVRQHHGDIQVTSTVGEGTTFQIELPAAQVPAELPESDS